MALIQCPECGREISDQASACPECAYPIAERRRSGEPPRVRTTEDSFLTRNRGFGDLALYGCLGVIVIFILVGVGLSSLSETPSPSERSDVTRPSATRRLEQKWAHGTVNVREGRGTNFDALTTLRSGESVQVDSLVGGWFRVFRAGERIGYASASVLHDGPIPASQFEVADISTRITEKNDTWWRFAWQMKIRNTGSRSLSLDATIEFQDKDGFVVDQDDQYNLFVAAGEEKTFTGFQLIRMPGAADVEKVAASATR